MISDIKKYFKMYLMGYLMLYNQTLCMNFACEKSYIIMHNIQLFARFSLDLIVLYFDNCINFQILQKKCFYKCRFLLSKILRSF